MLNPDPLAQFEHWLEQSVRAGLEDPTAMVLATVDAQGAPWQRIVLLKVARQPRVSLLFPWNELDRQVIIGGCAEKMTMAESAAYFVARPRESQIAAWASRQSRPVSARALLEKQVSVLKEKFGKGEIPVPDFWGGYRVQPDRIEFWQGREHRLHDRFQYTLQDAGHWDIEQLQP
jgi:pyridoxamine 5'-phosphate oxidase